MDNFLPGEQENLELWLNSLSDEPLRDFIRTIYRMSKTLSLAMIAHTLGCPFASVKAILKMIDEYQQEHPPNEEGEGGAGVFARLPVSPPAPGGGSHAKDAEEPPSIEEIADADSQHRSTDLIY